jgi:putative ABC transport system permease protein
MSIQNNSSSFHIKDSFYSCYLSIVNHKFRSFLTTLGILIGVLSVVTMFSAVHGLTFYMQEQMKKMGWNNSIIVTSGSSNNSFGAFRRRFRFRRMKRSEKPLTIADYYYLKAKTDARESFAVSVEDWKRIKMNNKYDWTMIKGTTNGFFRSQSYNLDKGRMFSDYESKKRIKCLYNWWTVCKRIF